MRPPTVSAAELRPSSQASALNKTELVLGAPDSWPSALMLYRLISEWQQDWREEVGHWLLHAEKLGFLGRVQTRLVERAKSAVNCDPDSIDPNDNAHTILHQELAGLLTVYYFTNLGWTFDAWEPKSPQGSDVDVRLTSPDGTPVDMQVKGCDRPGRVDACGQIIDGQRDEWVHDAIRKGLTQLRGSPSQTRILVVNALRHDTLAASPAPVIRQLMGLTLQDEVGVTMPPEYRGIFFSPMVRHVSAVVLLNYWRPEAYRGYFCTVLLNPLAAAPVSPCWFPRAFVLHLVDLVFRWLPRPFCPISLRDGTTLSRVPDNVPSPSG